MTTTVRPIAEPTRDLRTERHEASVARAVGLELLGPLRGAGYRSAKFLLRRADGQVLQVGPVLYCVLECMDGRRSRGELAARASTALGRSLAEEQLDAVLQKLGAQGLLAGTEQNAPPKRHPLLALRWRILVTNPRTTRLFSDPFTFMFRPWVMWPIVAAFAVVCWYVFVARGLASAISQSFHDPGLLLLVFALGVFSAGFHELGHAAGCRYGGATPRGMGVGLYLVFPAFYTDVTDAYRLDRRGRLRVDLAGLYFNAAVAVAMMAAWLVVHVDALLLVVALQVLQMVKQLSPIIRADGYHILSDATGVPDLYAHLGPTLRRLLPSRRHRRDPSPIKGGARVFVTLWVLVIVPVLLSLLAGAVVLLPHLAASAWASGRHLADHVPDQFGHGDVLGGLASTLQLLALALPVAGSVFITQKVARSTFKSARRWSARKPARQATATTVAMLAAAGLAFAWWPAGQYRPVRPSDRGNIGSLVSALGSAGSVTPPATTLVPGTYLAAAMIPVGNRHDAAVFVVPGARGRATMLLSKGTGAGASFPFTLPSKPGPDGTQAVALGTRDHGVTYDVAYAVVTVGRGRPVSASNSAFALADCRQCTTVGVSFQIVLVVGRSKVVAPTDAAVAANDNCPACTTSAIARQLVVTLDAQPSAKLEHELEATLSQLNLLGKLGAHGTPSAVAAVVGRVGQEVDAELQASGLEPSSAKTSTANGSSTGSGTTASSGTGSQDTSSTTSSTTTSSSTSSTTTATSTSTTTATTTTTSPTTTTTASPTGSGS